MLEAQSALTIYGNSSCIAAWDRRLGFTYRRCTATLRSLSPEGGPAALLDLTILKIYPIGYKETGEANREKPSWNEAEERARQNKWEVRQCPLSASLGVRPCCSVTERTPLRRPRQRISA